MNARVVAALVVVAHLEKGSVGVEILLEGLEVATVERKLEVALLKAHLVVETATGRDVANLVQVLTMAARSDKLNANSDLAIAVVVNLGLVLLVL